MRPHRSPDEAERLAALRRYEILDTSPEQAFDDLTLLATHICNAPIAYIGFIDADRQWLKSQVGLTFQEIPRHVSFCSHAILEPVVCVVRDALADKRFAHNPLVTSEPHIRFYAAAQLVTPEGHVVGTICVMDRVPRDLSAEQVETLRVLARQVVAQLELRRRSAQVEYSFADNERANEEILFQASLLNAVEEAVIATDVSGKIVYWNRFAEKMYGWSAAEVRGRNVVEVMASDVLQGEAAEIMSRLRRGESWSGEFIVRRRDGSSFPAQVTGSPIYSSDGALIGTVGISTDITERKRAEEALGEAHAELERRVAQRTAELTTTNALLKEEIAERKRAEQALLESNSLLRGVIEGTTDFIFAKDLDGRYLMVNTASANFVGKPAEEIVGKTDAELFPPEIAQQLIEHDRRVIASGEMLTLEEKLLNRGTLQTALVVKNVYRNEEGEPVGLIGISHDITERKRFEEEIVASKLQLAVAQQIAHMGSWAREIPANKVSWSDELYRIFGLEPQEFSASYEGFLERVHPDDREFVKGIIEKALRDHKPFDYECRAVRRHGEVRTLRARGEVVTDESGRAVKMYGTVEDITERKQAGRAIKIAPTLILAGAAAVAALTVLEITQRLLTRFISEGVSLSIPIILGSVAVVGITYFALRRLEALYRRTLEEITERQRLDEALRASEEHFRLLVEGIKDYAIFMLDDSGRVASWNEGAARLEGYLPEEIIGQHFSIFYTPDDVASGKPARALEKAATGRHEEECWIVRKDGTRLWADVLINASRDERGRLRGFVNLTRDITERKRAEESLRLFESAIEQANEAITITTPELDPPGPRIIFVNPAFTHMTGYSAAEVLGQTPRILQGPKTERAVLDELREKLARGEAFEGMAINYRKDGSEFYLEWRVDPIRNERGEVTHFVAVQRDVTERMRAKEARMQLQLQLIAAHEEERRRLSRELHDQIGQYLPALMLGLKALEETVPSQPHHATQVGQLQKIATHIAHDVQNLARELRPAALDEFGLANTLTSYVEEWSQRHGIAVDFHRTGFDGDARLPPHVEMTLYRIAQEAFTNILKHAQARDVSLILERKRRGVKMIVEDDGQGFDVEALMKAPPAERRLGLLGMRERVALINGSLQIESAPGAGTTIVVNLPVPAKEEGDAP